MGIFCDNVFQIGVRSFPVRRIEDCSNIVGNFFLQRFFGYIGLCFLLADEHPRQLLRRKKAKIKIRRGELIHELCDKDLASLEIFPI
jgi:hypothetical protein